MSEQPPPDSNQPTADATAASPRDLDFEQARLAYSIVESLLEHTQVLSDLLALMAQVIDEETTKALTQTPNWAAYLESRRRIERTRADVEKFTGILNRLGENKKA